ncbi:MAG: IgA Peptidase M64 [Bacteroidales bacterium]|nr:IgA Peptidase M64 [Bacteroidales bacterium]
MKTASILAAAALCCAANNQASAVNYDKHFSDSTLRIDYVLQGTEKNVNIGLRHMTRSPHWAGRKGQLDQLHLGGNGDITVTTLAGDTIYRNSYSTLFNEWLRLGDSVPGYCEVSLLVPMPRERVKITNRLMNEYRQPIATVEHTVDPTDILIRDHSKAVKPHEYIHKGSAPGPHIGVAFLAEGYTQEEMDVYMNDCREAVDAMFSHEPFKEMKEHFDFIAVHTPSIDSGVSVPLKNEWKRTAYGSHYSTFYSDRYLTSPNVFTMYDDLNGIPAQHIIVLVNSPVYGGGGIFNDYTLTAAHHDKFRPVVVHEFGHSFGGLADEYFYEVEVMSDTYPLTVEPWEPNITTLVDFDSKWKGMLAPDTPIPTLPEDSDKYPLGVYEGGGYAFKGIYRPVDTTCRMRFNEAEAFCPACQKAIRDIILYYISED